MNLKFINTLTQHAQLGSKLSIITVITAFLSAGMMSTGCEDQSQAVKPALESTDQGVIDFTTVSEELDLGSDMLTRRPSDQGSELDLETTPLIQDMMVVDMAVDMTSIPGIDPEFVMNEVQLLPSVEGFDLTGDGMVNNGLSLLFEDEVVGSVLGGDPNEYIARTVRRGELLLLLDFIQLHDLVDDDRFSIDIFLGRDTDSRRRNNFNGEQDFYVTCSSLNEEGEAGSRFSNVSLSEGVISGERGQFRFLISFAGDTEVVLQQAKIYGQFSEDGELITEGLLGGAVSFAELEEVVRNDPEIGPGFAQVMLNFLSSKLDVDLDGDGSVDALSASFRFTAVRGVVDRMSPCAE